MAFFGKKNNKEPLEKVVPVLMLNGIYLSYGFIFLYPVSLLLLLVFFLMNSLEALFYNYTTVAIMLIIFGIAFIIVETMHHGKKPKVRHLTGITYKLAFYIGLFQLIAAIFPGTSRSGATIVGALMLGISRTVAAEYTFFLAVPVMFGASLLKGA